MAMYVMEEMPDIHGTGEQVLYPRFAMMDQVSTEELIRQIASSSGFNVGDVEGVITQIGIEMAHQMAEGKSVKLDGIGTFSPSLALCKDKEREKAGEGETHRNARSIVVGNVNFRVDRKMIRRINGDVCWKEPRGSRNVLHRSILRSNGLHWLSDIWRNILF
jgi:predicted histone-like DNA-binding protein